VRVVTGGRETRKGLRTLRRELVRQLGKPRRHVWGFPGLGGRDRLPTWYDEVAGEPLAVAMGDTGSWTTRTPILLARSPLTPVMTPTVELNIPVGNGRPDRSVNGCLCVAHRGQFVLAHRGTSFTATPSVIPKKAVHRWFAKWLQMVSDGIVETPVIPVGPVGPGFTAQLASFADKVAALKGTWNASNGSLVKTSQSLGWREDLNFPAKIERALSASVKTFDYRHGPIQAGLQTALKRLVPPCCHPVLNAHVDLAIMHANDVLAIFEVKTDFGQQLFSGGRSAALLPAAVRPAQDASLSGRSLGCSPGRQEHSGGTPTPWSWYRAPPGR
jgi:hypothetical protein